MRNLDWLGEKIDCAVDSFMNSAHMEELDFIIVLSTPNLAASSFATLTICVILLGLMSAVFLATNKHCEKYWMIAVCNC